MAGETSAGLGVGVSMSWRTEERGAVATAVFSWTGPEGMVGEGSVGEGGMGAKSWGMWVVGTGAWPTHKKSPTGGPVGLFHDL